MERSLFLFILMGSFSTCRLVEFHFIQEEKTWTEAQKYCREKYTDLVTVKNMTDVMRLSNSVNYTGEAWIGLEYKTGIEYRRWHWSLSTVEFNESETNWSRGDWPKQGPDNNWVAIDDSTAWINAPCGNKLPFLCYDENQSKKIYLINESMTWREAQSYCRENHTDLISGIHQFDEIPNDIREDIRESRHYYWIGLFRDNWWWSDRNHSSLRNWDNDQPDNTHNNKCTTMLSETGKWKAENCDNTKKPFFCYDDKVILIQENKTWSEALSYCRENHHDLVSITDHSQQRWVQSRLKNATTFYVWLGLRYTCALDFWFWVSNEVVCYQNWIRKDQMEGCNKSGAMDRGGEWVKMSDEEKFNFVCVRKK